MLIEDIITNYTIVLVIKCPYFEFTRLIKSVFVQGTISTQTEPPNQGQNLYFKEFGTVGFSIISRPINSNRGKGFGIGMFIKF